jgi:hypothetical protein
MSASARTIAAESAGFEITTRCCAVDEPARSDPWGAPIASQDRPIVREKKEHSAAPLSNRGEAAARTLAIHHVALDLAMGCGA